LLECEFWGPLQTLVFGAETIDIYSMIIFRKSETICPETPCGRPSLKDKNAMDAVVRFASKGESICQIAKRKGMPSKSTIYEWLKCPEYRARFDEALDSHHLKKSGGRPYQMRVMIDRGQKMVGKRITIPLETHDLDLAKLKRDAILAFLSSQGVKLVGYFPKVLKVKS
jgi:hypothetical protein